MCRSFRITLYGLMLSFLLTACLSLTQEQPESITSTGQIQKLSAISMTIKIEAGSSRNDLTLDVSGIDVSMFYEGDIVTVTHSGSKVIAMTKHDSMNPPQTARGPQSLSAPARTEEMISKAGPDGNGGMPSGVSDKSGNTIRTNTTVTSASYSSAGDNENALLVDGARVTLDKVTITKNGDTGNEDLFSANAALLVLNKANVTIKDSTIVTAVINGIGVSSHGTGTAVRISDCIIMTTGDSSAGIQTADGATLNTEDLMVSTFGSSSAAIRIERGIGTVNVNGGSFVTSGYDSPAVWSAADITVTAASLTARNSAALVIEGHSSLTLEDCGISGSMKKEDTSSGNIHTIMLCQPMSGDVQEGTATLSITGGTLTGSNGDLIYVENTAADITISGAEVINKDSGNVLLRITGSNGRRASAKVTFSGDMTISGDILVDTASGLDLLIGPGVTFNGRILVTDNAEGVYAASHHVNVTVEDGAEWNLTGDSNVTSLIGNANSSSYLIKQAP